MPCCGFSTLILKAILDTHRNFKHFCVKKSLNTLILGTIFLLYKGGCVIGKVAAERNIYYWRQNLLNINSSSRTVYVGVMTVA